MIAAGTLRAPTAGLMTSRVALAVALVLALTACDSSAPSTPSLLPAPQATADMSATLRELARAFYAAGHSDEFDELVMWTDERLHYPKTFYLPARNDIRGIGATLFDSSFEFGATRHRLRGVVLMGTDWQEGLTRQGPDSTLGLLAQETAHAFGVFFKAREQRLVGRQHAHWTFFVDSGGSPMGGNDWRELGPTRFAADPPTAIRYNDLELYAMGALPAKQVSPLRIIEGVVGCDACTGDHASEHVEVQGSARTIEMAEIVALNGHRMPESDSGVQLRQAWILLTPEGAAPNPQLIAQLRRLAVEWPRVFAEATRGMAGLKLQKGGER